MTKRSLRVSGVSALAAAVLVLLPALAWLQHSWLDQIADADRDRRERTLQTALAQLAQAFDGELSNAIGGLQLEGPMVEQQAWSGYAARYQAWAETAIAPDIIKAVYFAEAPSMHGSGASSTEVSRETTPVLRVWNAQTRSFEITEWPAELQPAKVRVTSGDRERRFEFQSSPPPRGRGGDRFERFIIPSTSIGDAQLIVLPVMLFTPRDEPPPSGPPPPPDVRLLGFTVLRLDLAALSREVLPELVRRHLADDRGNSDYHVAVVQREDPAQIVYESDAGAAKAALPQPDASTTLLGARLGMVFMGGRGEPRRTDERVVVNVFEARRGMGRGNARVESRFLNGGEGHWRVVAKHRAGSLEAAVAAARTRNFVLSSGILALLAAAIGLIVVSARRADRLAKQQLEFVAAVSHELRTPVSVIGAAADNLAGGVVEEPGRVKKYGETIQGEARRLAETVERVLQLAGIASGKALATRAAIPAADLVRSAVEASRHEIEKADATIEVEIAPALLNLPTDPTGVQRVIGDSTALRSAIHNLISNAIKYGGHSPWVRVTASSPGHHATRITVEDHGLGVSSEDRKHIFEPFYRGREAVARQIQGSGLGLHLVKRIIEAHDGTVSVQSEPGRGSTFTIDLPGVHEVVRLRHGHESPAGART